MSGSRSYCFEWIDRRYVEEAQAQGTRANPFRLEGCSCPMQLDQELVSLERFMGIDEFVMVRRMFFGGT
jgi:hypothetical protein